MATCASFPVSHCQWLQAGNEAHSGCAVTRRGFLHWLLLQLVLLIDKSTLLNNEGLFCPLCYYCDLCQYPQVVKNKVVWTF